MSRRKNVPIITTESYSLMEEDQNLGQPMLSQHEEWERLQAQAAPMVKSREEILAQYGVTPPKVESSLPYEGLKENTKGFTPRSRTPFTRESSLRNQKFIDYYDNSAITTHKGKTYFDPEKVPEGYVGRYVRASVKGRDDQHRLNQMENIGGWEYAASDQIPHMAYQDEFGNVKDSASSHEMGGLVFMIRAKEIHQAHLNHLEKLRNVSTNMQTQMRSVNGDLHPFATNQNDSGQMFFPSNETSRSFQGSF